MAKLQNVTTTEEINVTPRAIDFVSSFSRTLERFLEVAGQSRFIAKTPGTTLRTITATISTASSPAEGYAVPLSLASVVEAPIGTIALEKYRKGVTAEAIEKDGYDIAVAKTDEAMLNEHVDRILNKFYSFLSTGTLSASATGFQAALASSIGAVKNYFKSNSLSYTGTVAFVNLKDFYTYLGGASITVQNEFGMFYIQNFMGAEVVILCDDNCVPQGKMYVTAINNIVGYHINPANSDYARAGLVYYTDQTGLIGAAEEGNYEYVAGILNIIYGITIFAEYLAGVCVATIN